ncbi:NAD(P)-binding protein, partial [Setomelanomma holmii]
PELSQAGRTILVTGGAGGIGLATARSFAQAGASRIVIISRRAEKLADAKKELEALNASSIEVVTYSCDIADMVEVQRVWDDLNAEDISVDVLVLNAAAVCTLPQGLAEDDLVAKVWSTFETNVRSALQMTDIFLKQGSKKGKVRSHLAILNASATHLSPIRTVQLGYAASKTGLGSLMQGFADALDPEECQIINFHPGSVKSEAVMKSKWANAPLAWNTDTLPSDFAVWSSSKEARFLHGRFVWCNWDI